MTVYTARASSFVGNSDVSLDLESEHEFFDEREKQRHREKITRREKYRSVKAHESKYSMDIPKLYLDTRKGEENEPVIETKKTETKEKKSFEKNIKDLRDFRASKDTKRRRKRWHTSKERREHKQKSKPEDHKRFEIETPLRTHNASAQTPFPSSNLAPLRTLVTIVCGTNQRPDDYQRNIFARQLNQTKAMLKSLVYFSTFTSFRIILVTDTVNTYDKVLQQIEDWPVR